MPLYLIFGYTAHMHPVDEIFEAFGNSPTRLAKATGLKVQTVFDWRAKAPKNIPDWRRPIVLAAIERLELSISSETREYLEFSPQPQQAA